MDIYVPVIEFEQYLQEVGRREIDKVIYLQHFAEGWKDGKFEIKWEKRPCIDGDRYYQKEDGKWSGWFWGYESSVHARSFECVSVQGQSSTLVPVVLQEKNMKFESILIERAETVLHDHFGDVQYWRARRSMRYSPELRQIADDFRRKQLSSDDAADSTVLGDDWSKTEAKHGQAKGGPYLAVHWRRKDFVRAHGKDLPSINGTAQQITGLLQRLNLDVVYLATDAPQTEVDQLISYLPKSASVKRFAASSEILGKYKD
uniref:GDP-fucose protein O-fucosyltransferase 2 n=1 Tax=Plectus sambesii TaxID=2011161 RepID=A0A914V2N1_9BILA